MISKKMQKKSTNQKTNNLISPTFIFEGEGYCFTH